MGCIVAGFDKILDINKKKGDRVGAIWPRKQMTSVFCFVILSLRRSPFSWIKRLGAFASILRGRWIGMHVALETAEIYRNVTEYFKFLTVWIKARLVLWISNECDIDAYNITESVYQSYEFETWYAFLLWPPVFTDADLIALVRRILRTFSSARRLAFHNSFNEIVGVVNFTHGSFSA